MSLQTLEQYLRDTADAGVIDHSLRVRVQSDGGVTFYIHPAGTDGPTLDFIVGGNGLSRVSQSVERATVIGPVGA